MLSRLFRRLFLERLTAAYQARRLEFFADQAALAEPAAFKAYLAPLRQAEWVVYAKRPFAGPKQVLAYLSRYTHRVAISNRRLISADEQTVSFDYKDYAQGAKHKTMILGIEEFVRRFCLHVLPARFVKIRHYGLLGNRQRQQRLACARKLLGVISPPEPCQSPTQTQKNDESPRPCCPFCHRPTLVFIGEIAPSQRRWLVANLDSS